MKKLHLLGLFLCCVCTYAQNSYFITNKNEKVYVDDNSLQIISIDKRISYKLPGKEWEKYIRFKDLDYVVYGSTMFKTFNLNGKKKSSGYFVLAISDEKKLVCKVMTLIRKTYNVNYYTYLILDKEDNVLVEDTFSGSDIERNDEKKSLAQARIKEHFSDCNELMQRLKENIDSDGFLEFFNMPVYINCNN